MVKGDLKMNEGQDKQSNLIDTTDCLEAIGVFRGWKNFLFIIAICCLLLLQASFWLVNTGYVKADDTKTDIPAVVTEDTEKTDETIKRVAAEPDKIQEAAKQVVAEPNQPTEAVPQQTKPQKTGLHFGIKFKRLAGLIRFFNFVLILTASLYCLTMLFSLKVSMLGRLGGINHISRAFFLSLAFLVLLLPWQRFFTGIIVGAMYTPQELLNSYAAARDSNIFGKTLYYLRFTGYWLVVLLLLIFSQLRNSRWAKAILRRLEVI